MRQGLIKKVSSAPGVRSVPFWLLLALNQSACGTDPLIAPDTNADKITLTSIGSSLPENAFKAIITRPYSEPARLKAGQHEAIHFVVRNAGEIIWPSAGRGDGQYQIRLGNRWLDQDHRERVADDGRSALPYDLRPGDEAEFLLTITAPEMPGEYVLEVDMVQEQVTWFRLKGSKTLQLKLTVE